MLSVKVKTKGSLSGFDRLLKRHLSKALDLIGKKVSEDARREHRYTSRTGNLTSATTYYVDNIRQRVVVYIQENRAEYGKYVHDGTSNWRPDKFIDRAFIKNAAWINKVLEDAVDKAISDLNRRR
jgi:hypothetical protein